MRRFSGLTRFSAALGCVVFGCCLPSSSASAQEDPPKFEITGFVGALNISQNLGTVSTLFVDVSGQALNSDFGKHYGIRGSYALTRNLAIEGNFSQAESSFTFSAEDIDAGSVELGSQIDTDHQFYGVGVVVQFPVGMLVPYGTVGAGQYKLTPSTDLADVTEITTSDIYFGAGIKLFVSRHVGVRFDFRRHQVSDGIAFAGSSGEPDLIEYSIGIVIGF